MTPASDGRRTGGAQIEVLAISVTSEAECKRLYGNNWRVKKIYGFVISSHFLKPEFGSRAQSCITV